MIEKWMILQLLGTEEENGWVSWDEFVKRMTEASSLPFGTTEWNRFYRLLGQLEQDGSIEIMEAHSDIDSLRINYAPKR